RAGHVTGVQTCALPILAKGAASMVKRVPVSSDRKAELREDFAKNVPQHIRRALSAYVQWPHEHERPAERLCRSGVPTWIVHAERSEERRVGKEWRRGRA